MLTDPTSGIGYSFGQTLPSADATSIVLQLPYALDGNGGGTYNPSAFINIGGSGIRTSVTFRVTAGGASIAGGILVPSGDCIFSGDLDVIGTMTADGPFVADDVSSFAGASTFTEDSTWNNKNAVFKDGGGTPIGTIGNGFGLLWTILATFTGRLACQGELDLSTGGTVRERITYGTDADATLTYGTVGQIHIFPTTMSTTRTIKLGDAPHEGCRLRLVNLSGSDQTIQNSGGGSILLAPGPLPAVASFVPGVMDLVWANGGSYTGWIQVGQ